MAETEEKKTTNSVSVDESALKQVSGGRSLYEEADGLNRDSWFVSLVSKVRGEEQTKPTQSAQNNPVPLSTFIVGEYSSLSEQ